MRPGQHQNRRGRGRNGNNNSGGGGGGNNNRKGQNPLTRSFESNGPDVKVRGTPAHIAEKYLALARDAQSSGDRVLAESYLQHAEHYNRIIMAYREQYQTPGEQPNLPRRGPGFETGDAMGDDDGSDGQVEDLGGDQQQPVGYQSGAMNGNPVPEFGGNPGQPPNQNQHRQNFRNEGRFEGRNDQYARGEGQPGRYGQQYNRDDRNGEGYQQRGDRPFRRDGQYNNNGQRFRDRNNDRHNRPQQAPVPPSQSGQGSSPQGYYGNDRPNEARPDRPERIEGGPEQRTEGHRPEHRDYRQDRGPRPDRPVRIDRGEQPVRPQPTYPAPQQAFEPSAEPAHGLPAFVATPVTAPPQASEVPAPAPVPAAPQSRRREKPVADAVASDGAPEFLRRPVRRSRAAAPPAAAPASDAPSSPAAAPASPPTTGNGETPSGE